MTSRGGASSRVSSSILAAGSTPARRISSEIGWASRPATENPWSIAFNATPPPILPRPTMPKRVMGADMTMFREETSHPLSQRAAARLVARRALGANSRCPQNAADEPPSNSQHWPLDRPIADDTRQNADGERGEDVD